MKLNTLLISSLSVLAASAFAGAPAKAPAVVQPPAEEPLGFTVTVGYDTHYIFRGVLFAENLVTAAVPFLLLLNFLCIKNNIKVPNIEFEPLGSFSVVKISQRDNTVRECKLSGPPSELLRRFR